jgi:isoleucyl-tRNA synthetase
MLLLLEKHNFNNRRCGISSQDIEWLVANSNGITVALILLFLRIEKRRYSKRVSKQNSKHQKGFRFEVTDKIKVHLQKNDTLEGGKPNVEYIKSETLTEELVFEDDISENGEIEFDEIKTKIKITK